MSTDGEQGGVTQADRDAAAKIFGKTDWSYSQFVTGKRDKDEKVLAFMRHRLAHAVHAPVHPLDAEVYARLLAASQIDKVIPECDPVLRDRMINADFPGWLKEGEYILAALAKHPTSPEDAA